MLAGADGKTQDRATFQQAIEPDLHRRPNNAERLRQLGHRRASGRRDPREITIFDSVGCAIEDFSALLYLLDRIHGSDFFEEIDLLAEPSDPRDLFSLLKPSRSGDPA